VSTEFLPKQVRPNRALKKAPDLARIAMGQICSQAFKDVLEDLEPGVHQFEPVEVVTKKKVHIQEMYWLIPCNRLDTLVLDQINPPVNDMGYFRAGLQRGELKIVFDKAKIGDHHLWTERRNDGSMYVSDAFANAAKDAGLVGLKLPYWQDI
jgi:hypothetical protein